MAKEHELGLLSTSPSFDTASPGDCGQISEFKRHVCNMGIITRTDLARVLKVNSLMFVKGFAISDARCCTLGEAILLT